MFEDSPAGVEAAVAAGMSVVLVPDPRLANADRLNPPATYTLGSLEAIEPTLFGWSPFAPFL